MPKEINRQEQTDSLLQINTWLHIMAAVLAFFVHIPNSRADTVCIKVISAKISPKKSNGLRWDTGIGAMSKPDAFVVLEIAGNRFQTSIQKNTLTPQWDQMFCPSNLTKERLYFRVMDKDLLKDDLIGEGSVSIDRVYCPIFTRNIPALNIEIVRLVSNKQNLRISTELDLKSCRVKDKAKFHAQTQRLCQDTIQHAKEKLSGLVQGLWRCHIERVWKSAVNYATNRAKKEKSSSKSLDHSKPNELNTTDDENRQMLRTVQKYVVAYKPFVAEQKKFEKALTYHFQRATKKTLSICLHKMSECAQAHRNHNIEQKLWDYIDSIAPFASLVYEKNFMENLREADKDKMLLALDLLEKTREFKGIIKDVDELRKSRVIRKEIARLRRLRISYHHTNWGPLFRKAIRYNFPRNMIIHFVENPIKTASRVTVRQVIKIIAKHFTEGGVKTLHSIINPTPSNPFIVIGLAVQEIVSLILDLRSLFSSPNISETIRAKLSSPEVQLQVQFHILRQLYKALSSFKKNTLHEAKRLRR